MTRRIGLRASLASALIAGAALALTPTALAHVSTLGADAQAHAANASGVTLTKTADSATSTLGGTDGYTVTLTNGNASAVSVRWIRDYLAGNFSYVPGSTSGAISADPTGTGSLLIWAGPFTIPAGGSFSYHYNIVTGGSRARCSGNRANALVLDPTPHILTGTNGRIAQICVAAGGPPALIKTADSPSTPRGGTNGYTLTLTNPTAHPLIIRWLRDYLPLNFTYVLGSTSGTISSNPAIFGGQLRWRGPFSVAAGSSFHIHFSVIVGGRTICVGNRSNAFIVDPTPRLLTGTNGRIARVCVT
jgi:uncharacterized repeat protein (TIGR01451 family)